MLGSVKPFLRLCLDNLQIALQRSPLLLETLISSSTISNPQTIDLNVFHWKFVFSVSLNMGNLGANIFLSMLVLFYLALPFSSLYLANYFLISIGGDINPICPEVHLFLK